MKLYLIILVALIVSCNTLKKSSQSHLNTVNTTHISERDSSVVKKTDSVALHKDSSGTVSKTDSTYSKKTEEEIIEWIIAGDSNEGHTNSHSRLYPEPTILRKTKRVITETGQKKNEQITKTENSDSTHKTDIGETRLNEKNKSDSTAVNQSTDTSLTIKRFPWFWAIVIVCVCIGIYKRHSIIKFFT